MIQKPINPSIFRCLYCGKDYVRESAFIKHKCEQMARHQQSTTIVGQEALAYYQFWLEQTKKFNPSPAQFLTSKTYNAFIKFAKFVKEVNIFEPVGYMRLMIARKMLPCFWVRDESYGLYLEYLQRELPPMEQVRLSLKLLLKTSEWLGCEVSQVFTVIELNTLIQQIRERKLTPWLLLHSHTFKEVFRKSTPEQQQIIEGLIRPQFWSYSFQKHPAITSKIKKIVGEIEI